MQASAVALVFEAREREQQTGEGFYWFRGRLAAAIGYGAVAGSAAAVGLLLVIPGLALLARWCVGVPAVVDALHPSIRDGFDSSLELTRRDERGARRLVMATVGAAVVAHVLIAQAAAAATGVATAGWLGAFVADILVGLAAEVADEVRVLLPFVGTLNTLA